MYFKDKDISQEVQHQNFGPLQPRQWGILIILKTSHFVWSVGHPGVLYCLSGDFMLPLMTFFFQNQQKSIKRPLIAITITSMHDYDLHISYYPYILSIVSILSILSNILTTVFRLYTYLHTSSSRFASPQRPRRSNALPRWHVVPESCVEKGLSSDLAQFG